jgi:hypothetical protein
MAWRYWRWGARSFKASNLHTASIRSMARSGSRRATEGRRRSSRLQARSARFRGAHRAESRRLHRIRWPEGWRRAEWKYCYGEWKGGEPAGRGFGQALGASPPVSGEQEWGSMPGGRFRQGTRA